MIVETGEHDGTYTNAVLVYLVQTIPWQQNSAPERIKRDSALRQSQVILSYRQQG